MEHKIWFITGISSGLGQAIAKVAIEKGDFVIGTFRQQPQVDGFNAQHAGRALGLLLDVTQPQEITSAFTSIENRFGRLDVLVNNAGYGIAGAIEETSSQEARELFEANFFGTLQITQMALPLFRKQKSGHIIQISSHGGFKAFQGFGLYNASKFAVEGFSEALAQEVLPLGIKVTIVEPGPFRTHFAGTNFRQAQTVIDDYQQTAGVFRQRIKAVDGHQEGDPTKAAGAIYNITGLAYPPLRLPLGKIALASIAAKLDSVANDLAAYKEIAANTVYG